MPKRGNDRVYAQGGPKVPRNYVTDSRERDRENTFEGVFREIDSLHEIIEEGNSDTVAELFQYSIEKDQINVKFDDINVKFDEAEVSSKAILDLVAGYQEDSITSFDKLEEKILEDHTKLEEKIERYQTELEGKINRYRTELVDLAANLRDSLDMLNQEQPPIIARMKNSKKRIKKSKKHKSKNQKKTKRKKNK